MTAFQTVDVLPSITLAAGDKAVSRIQVAKQGTFFDPRYGKFAITQKDFDEWLRNARALHFADGKVGIPVDTDHDPGRGDTEAVGWIVSLDQLGADGKTATPTELWGTVEWNSVGRELVADRRYAYISPEFHPNYRDEQGKSLGNVLLGVALTNRPFLRTGMATVSLSESVVLATEVISEDSGSAPPSDSPGRMTPLTLTAAVAKALGVGEDADEAAVLSAIESKSSPAQAPVISLAEQAKAEGKVVVDADQLVQLTADAQAGAAAAKALSEQRFTLAWTEAVKDGRAIPAQEDTMRALYDVKPDETIKLLADAPQVVSTDAKGSGGGHDAGPAQSADTRKELSGETFGAPDDETARIHARALALAAEKSIPYAEAALLAEGEVS